MNIGTGVVDILVVEYLVFLLLFGNQNNQTDSDSQQSTENVDTNHGIKKIIHNNTYSLEANKLNDQNTNDRIAPDTSNVKLITPATNGPTTTDAKNT